MAPGEPMAKFFNSKRAIQNATFSPGDDEFEFSTGQIDRNRKERN